MPTYEYRCNGGGHEFEAFQSISEEPLKTCPACGIRNVKRLISAGAGLIFKGSGFYETDYKRKPATTDDRKVEKKDTGAQILIQFNGLEVPQSINTITK